MNLRTRAAAYGVAGLALSSGVILAGMTLGVISPASLGVLSVMLTDPSNVPKGVSAIYVTYDEIALHAAGLGAGQWVFIPGQGTLETLGLVNLSETISSANIPALNYDEVAFDIHSAQVKFHGVNYSATVNTGRLVAQIDGGLTVNPSKPAAVVVDLQPTVLNLGDQGVPNLVIAAGVRALPVPSGEVTDSMKVLKSRFSLLGHSWTQPLNAPGADNVSISQVRLTSNSFSFVATNHASEAVNLRMVVIAPASMGGTASGVTASLSGAFVLAVEPDGSLQLLHTGESGQAESVLANAGYSLSPGASATFSYTGALTTVAMQTAVSRGTSYYVFVVGQASVQQTVQAD